MWTLAPGMVVNVFGKHGELLNLSTGEKWTARSEDIDLLLLLAGGIEGDAAAHPALRACVENGWACEQDDTSDPFLHERLVTLDRRYRWCAGDLDANCLALVRKAHASRRHLQRSYAQYAALPETVARRVALLGKEPKRVLVLGDDDFLTLGLLAAGHDVTTLEIDPIIVRVLQRLAPAGTTPQIKRLDLRDPWPEDLSRGFDVFFADPLSGPYALRLFVSRGLCALSPGGAGYVCVSEPAQHSFEALRRSFDFDLVEHWSDFNHYYGPHVDLAQYVSDLVLIHANEHTQVSPTADERFYAPGLSIEDHFSASPASRYVLHNIDTRFAELLHLDTTLAVLKNAGQLDVLSQQMHHEGDLRLVVLVTRTGVTVCVRVDVGRRVAELFVAPAESALEDSLLACMFGPLKIKGTIVQKHRIRNSTLIRMI